MSDTVDTDGVLAEDGKPAFLFWVDLETTGLDPREDKILEIAWTLTRFEFPYDEVDKGYALVKQRVDPLEFMDDVVREMHTKNGLLKDLESFPVRGGASAWCDVVLDLMRISDGWPTSKEDKDRRVVIAGSTAKFDLDFLKHDACEFTDRLSHRVFDASNMYLVCRSLGMPKIPKPPEDDACSHRARYDVDRSIETMRTCVRWITGMAGGGQHVLAKHFEGLVQSLSAATKKAQEIFSRRVEEMALEREQLLAMVTEQQKAVDELLKQHSESQKMVAELQGQVDRRQKALEEYGAVVEER